MGDLTKDMSRREFACRCGCGADNIAMSLVNRLQAIRDEIGMPVSINSGVRCEAHNAAQGGKDGSPHVPADVGDGQGIVGHAADVSCYSSMYRKAFRDAAGKHFTRVGMGKDFVHVDDDPRKPQGVEWTYYDDDHVA